MAYIPRSEEEWQQNLSAEEYRVMREKGTEQPFTGAYNMHFEKGMYTCKGCGTELFEHTSKFDSGCGWPSFDRAKDEGVIREIRDTSLGMIRTEIVCGNCNSHLGHVFDDGPTDTGLRYCVNSVSLEFRSDH
jgi:peptide-methionine (R)-S-oxide reductase